MMTLFQSVAAAALPGVEHHRLRAYAVLLLRHQCANNADVPGHQRGAWEVALGEAPDDAMQRLTRNGLIGPASVESAVTGQSKATIQQMLTERGLPSARTKVDGAKCLVANDPEGMRALAKKENLIEITDLARPIIEAFQQEEQLAKSVAHNLALTALSEGRIEDACEIATKHDARQVIDHGSMFSMQTPPATFRRIFELRPTILEGMPEASWQLIRIPTAMQLLFRDPVRTWLPHGSLQHPWLNDDACCRMLMFAASHATSLEGYRESGCVTGVTALTATDTTKVCPACLADAGRYFPLSEAPIFPHAQCTCGIGCPCDLAPCTQDLSEGKSTA